jgi:hypothetical protein
MQKPNGNCLLPVILNCKRYNRSRKKAKSISYPKMAKIVQFDYKY